MLSLYASVIYYFFKAWKSTSTGWEEMSEEDYGQFYSNRCYVYHEIRTPEVGKAQSKVYFWQGIAAANRFWIRYKYFLIVITTNNGA